jgi:hypothetical protein
MDFQDKEWSFFFVEWSSTCSTKELSIHLTKILSAVKEGQQKYIDVLRGIQGLSKAEKKFAG